MRKRIGNPAREPHGKPMRAYDLIAPGSLEWAKLPAMIQAAIPGLILSPFLGGSEVNGFINTSPRPDGTRHVAIYLYDFECADPTCPLEHFRGVIHRVAPLLTPAQESAMALAIGEAPGKILTNANPAAAEALLRASGFEDQDGPLRLD